MKAVIGRIAAAAFGLALATAPLAASAQQWHGNATYWHDGGGWHERVYVQNHWVVRTYGYRPVGWIAPVYYGHPQWHEGYYGWAPGGFYGYYHNGYWYHHRRWAGAGVYIYF